MLMLLLAAYVPQTSHVAQAMVQSMGQYPQCQCDAAFLELGRETKRAGEALLWGREPYPALAALSCSRTTRLQAEHGYGSCAGANGCARQRNRRAPGCFGVRVAQLEPVAPLQMEPLIGG